MAGIGTYGRSGTLTARNAEAGTLLGGVDDGAREVFARDAEAEPLEDEAELEMRELHEYMRKRVRCADGQGGRSTVLTMLAGAFQTSMVPGYLLRGVRRDQSLRKRGMPGL